MASIAPSTSDHRGDSGFDGSGQARLGLGVHRGDIQGLRAVAVLAVVLFHISEVLPGGFAGVDIFFVVSGFVITGFLSRSAQTGNLMKLRSFFWRRMCRLGPLLGLVVTITLILSVFLLSPVRQIEVAAQTGVGAVFLVSNLIIEQTSGDYFDLAAETNPLLNLWSLSVEEQFYLLFAPLLVLLFLARQWGNRRGHLMVGVLAAIAALSFLVARIESMNLDAGLPASLGGFYGAIPRLWEFLVGVLLALAWPSLVRHIPKWSATVLGWVGVVAISYTLFFINAGVPWPGSTTLLPVFGTALVIVGALGSAAFPISRLLGLRPLTWIGDRSYGWYLWHWPFIVLLAPLMGASIWGEAVAACLALIVSAVTYTSVEQPLRRVSFHDRTKRTLVLGLGTALPLLLGALVLTLIPIGFGSHSVATFREAIIQDHAGHSAGCDEIIGVIPPECQWNTELKGQPIYLIGDSNADQFSEAVIEAGRAAGRPVLIATRNACPFVTGEVRSPGHDEDWTVGCADYRDGIMDFLDTAEPGTVVLALSSGYADYNFGSVGSANGIAGLKEGVADAISSVARQHKVVWVEPVVIDSWSPQECPTVSILDSSCKTIFPEPESDAYDGLGLFLAKEFGSTIVRPSRAYCLDGTCSSVLDDVQVFRDSAHITVEASRAMTPLFLEVLEANLDRL